MKTNRLITLIVLTIISVFAFAACASSESGASQAVSAYLEALTSKDQDALLSHSCPEWETDAMLELDALNLVQTALKDLDCQVTSTEDDLTQVSCQGIIEATYGTEVQQLDLSQRTFQVRESSGDWLVCGYK